MKSRNIMLLLSLVLAVATAGMALFWLKNQGGVESKPVETAVLWTAKEEIVAGTLITDKMIVKKDVAQDQIAPGIYTDEKDIVGRYAKDTILKGESFPSSRLYTEEDRLLSMRLKPGFRAFSISLSPYSGVGDLLKPGDRVDVFVFLEEIEKNSVIIRPDFARIMIQDLEVLAVRKESRKEDTPPEEVTPLYAVTLAAPVKDIEKMILGEETGRLKVALRPIDDAGRYDSYGVIWKELMLDDELRLRDIDPDYAVMSDQEALNRVTDSVVEQGPPTAKPEQTQPIASSGDYFWYTVKYGDTLMSISRNFFGGSPSHYDEIMRMNGLSSSIIRPGQKLKISLTGR